MPPFRWSPEIEASLSALRARIELLRAEPLPSAGVESLRHWFRIHHAYHSNAIEGNTLTLAETRAVVEDGITIGGKSLREHTEAVNVAEAVDLVEAMARRDEPIGERQIKEIQAVVLRGIDSANAGRYRAVNVRISGSEHVPPEAVALPSRMEEYARWLSSPDVDDPVLQAAIAHAWFVNIHPFIDGNGRTGRLIANLVLLRRGYPITVLRVEERARYYEALHRADAGDLTEFVGLTRESVERSVLEYERIRGALRVEEPRIQTLARQLASAKPRGSAEFARVVSSLRLLHSALQDIGNRLREQVPSDVAVDLAVKGDGSVDPRDEQRARAGFVPVLELVGESAAGAGSIKIGIGKTEAPLSAAGSLAIAVAEVAALGRSVDRVWQALPTNAGTFDALVLHAGTDAIFWTMGDDFRGRRSDSELIRDMSVFELARRLWEMLVGAKLVVGGEAERPT